MILWQESFAKTSFSLGQSKLDLVIFVTEFYDSSDFMWPSIGLEAQGLEIVSCKKGNEIEPLRNGYKKSVLQYNWVSTHMMFPKNLLGQKVCFLQSSFIILRRTCFLVPECIRTTKNLLFDTNDH